MVEDSKPAGDVEFVSHILNAARLHPHVWAGLCQHTRNLELLCSNVHCVDNNPVPERVNKCGRNCTFGTAHVTSGQTCRVLCQGFRANSLRYSKFSERVVSKYNPAIHNVELFVHEFAWQLQTKILNELATIINSLGHRVWHREAPATGINPSLD
jgi:hypothetical protein